RGCDRLARRSPRPRPCRFTRSSPMNSWRRWCSRGRRARRRWRRSRAWATRGSRSTASGCWKSSAGSGPRTGRARMRRAGHLFERIVDRENLRLAVHKALRGKRSKQDARAFVARLDENLESMRAAIVSGEIALGEYHQFTIFDPKQRLITAPCFRERVLHHAIMNVCEPVFERWLIADTFACRRGKGRLAALHRARDFAGRSAFFLKLDVRKYFESISHEILAAGLERLFKDRRLMLLLRRILAGFASTPGRGL